MVTSKKDLQRVIELSRIEIGDLMEPIANIVTAIIDLDVDDTYEVEEKMEILKKITHLKRMLKNVDVMVYND